MVITLLFTSLMSFAQESTKAPSTINLTQKQAAELVLKNSTQKKEIDAKYSQNYAAVTSALSVYDWKLSVESGYENDRSATIITNDLKYERFKTTASLNKSLLTGTALTLEASRTSQRADVPSAYSSSNPSRSTLDSFGLTLEQQLLANSFGSGDRAVARAAELQFESMKPMKSDELETLVLQGINSFWSTYVAEENFKQSVAARDSYLKLVESVKRKTSYGYSNPGEVYQVQAELETRQQNVRSSSSEYLNQRNNLITLLSLDPKAELSLSVPSEIPPLPAMSPIDPEKSREIQSEKLRLSSLEEYVTISKNKTKPNLSLVGKLYSTGADSIPETALSNAVSAQNPKYYLGVKFVYSFGSEAQSEDLRAKIAAADQSRLKLQRLLKEKSDKLQNAERQVQANYSILLSIQAQKNFREKAVTELNRAYLQGRTDIKNLIDAMNNHFTAQIQYTKALGTYNISLNEWAALRDELVKEESKIGGNQ